MTEPTHFPTFWRLVRYFTKLSRLLRHIVTPRRLIVSAVLLALLWWSAPQMVGRYCLWTLSDSGKNYRHSSVLGLLWASENSASFRSHLMHWVQRHPTTHEALLLHELLILSLSDHEMEEYGVILREIFSADHIAAQTPEWRTEMSSTALLWPEVAKWREPDLARDLAESALEHLSVPQQSQGYLVDFLIPSDGLEPVHIRRRVHGGRSLSHSRDGERLYVYTDYGVRIVNAATEDALDDEPALSFIDVTLPKRVIDEPGGTSMAVIHMTGEVRFLDPATGTVQSVWTHATGGVWTGGWNRGEQGLFLGFGGDDKGTFIALWDPLNGEEVSRETLASHSDGSGMFAVNRENRDLAWAHSRGEVIEVAPMDWDGLAVVLDLLPMRVSPGLVSLSSGGETVWAVRQLGAQVGHDVIRIDVETGQWRSVLSGRGSFIREIQVAGQDRLLLVWSADNLLDIHDADSGDLLTTVLLPEKEIIDFSVSPSGDELVVICGLSSDHLAFFDLTALLTSPETLN